MKKLLLFLIFLLTIAVGGGAIYFGYFLNNQDLNPENVFAGGQISPVNCQDYWTKSNPKLDINMGINNDGPYNIVDYCPGETGQITVTKSGDLYAFVSRADVILEIDGQIYTSNTDGIIDTKLRINQGEKITVASKINDQYGIGWISPVDDICGKTEWGNQQLINDLITKVEAVSGSVIIEEQCWGDSAKGSQDFDFDDFQVILAVVPSSEIDVYNDQMDNDQDSFQDDSSVVETDSNINQSPLITSFPVIPADNNNDNQVHQCGPESQCEKDSNCTEGNKCISVGGTNRCVANICITDGQYNNACGANMCSIEYPIIVNKTADVSCIVGQEDKRILYTVILQNPEGNTSRRERISVEDILDTQVQSDFVIRRSIPFQGEYNAGRINWNDIIIGEGGASLELTYELIVPASEYGKNYTNTINVYEGGVFRGTATITHTIETLPCTAIISDKIDMIIIGVLITMTGILLYRLSIDKKIGKIIWNIGFGNALYNISRSENIKITQEEKIEFERRINKKNK